MKGSTFAILLSSALLVIAAISPSGALAAPPPPPGGGGTIQKPPPVFPRWAPDLTISSFSCTPNPAAISGFVTCTIGVTNQGILDATNARVHWAGGWGSFSQFFEGSMSATNGFQCYVPAEYYNMDVRCVGGTVGGLSTATITITVRGPNTAGVRSVSAVADPYNEIGESNEANNSASGTVTFQ